MTAHPPPEREPATRGSPHERKLAALGDRLDTEIRALRTGEDWAGWLRAAARMPGQDFAAVLLIAAQRPGAAMVAGYEAWQAAGRQVGKRERGIQILAPGPRLSYVWDISQTTGPPLPTSPAARLPAGQVPPGAWDALAALAASHGFSVGCGDCGGEAGATSWADRRIRVHPGLGAADALRALAHEVAHVLLHGQAAYPPPTSTARCRGVRKVEADSVAFVVCADLGLDVSGIVFPQVASWAGDDERARPAATVKEIADRILTAARTVTRHLTAPWLQRIDKSYLVRCLLGAALVEFHVSELERLHSEYLWQLCDGGAHQAVDLENHFVFVNLRNPHTRRLAGAQGCQIRRERRERHLIPRQPSRGQVSPPAVQRRRIRPDRVR